MQSIANFFKDFWQQLGTVLDDLSDWIIYVFDPNSGPWPKLIAGGAFFLIVLFVVTRASKAK